MSTLTISTIQSDLIWEDVNANLNELETKIKSLTTKTEIVVLPEMFSTGFSMSTEKFAESMDGFAVEWMKRVSRENKIILTGSLMIKENDCFYNRLIWMMPNGAMGYYDKRHLFGYGDEDKHFSAGNQRLIASVNGWKINLQICYDLRFPVWARQQSQMKDEQFTPEYDVLIYVANWPERRSHAWKTLLCARAMENQCYVVGVNRVGKDGNGIYHSGDSMIVDPVGEVLYHKNNEEDIFTITFNKEYLLQTRARFPFLKDADYFNIDL